ncbi:hypothetical protein HanIR_Chr10g0479261 [Helianthus annuus]|nr:hypothetical protein HanIR_Chr10g0479261 [Helianthus annuus]
MTAVSNSGYQHISGGMRRSMFGYGSSRHHTLSFSSGSLIERPEHESNLKARPSDPDPPRDNIFSWYILF